MNKRRLLKLADLLEADAKNAKGIQFNLCTIIRTDDVYAAAASGTVPMSCGTSACAVGLAALSGAFKRSAGLSYKLVHSEWGIEIKTTINGQSRAYDRAAMAVFGLTMRQVDFLFTPTRYGIGEPISGAIGERYVAKRIRDFVAGEVTA